MLPCGFLLGTGGYLFWKRREYLGDPILQRALLHLSKDQRVIDFCGDSIKPGYLVTRQTQPGENWIKYELNVSGPAGKLKATLIGDYLSHQDLLDLEQERKSFEAAVQKLKDSKAKLS